MSEFISTAEKRSANKSSCYKTMVWMLFCWILSLVKVWHACNFPSAPCNNSTRHCLDQNIHRAIEDQRLQKESPHYRGGELPTQNTYQHSFDDNLCLFRCRHIKKVICIHKMNVLLTNCTSSHTQTQPHTEGKWEGFQVQNIWQD